MHHLRIKEISKFIKEIRETTDIDKEKELVNRKMNKIRTKFEKNSKNADNKKYMWMLAYAKITGYKIDFGHKQIGSLIDSDKYSEKYTGYVTTSILVEHEQNDVYYSYAQKIKRDLFSSDQKVRSLALNLVSSTVNAALICDPNFKIYDDVMKLALGESDAITEDTRKKALLCLLRIYRQFKGKIQFNVKSWISRLNKFLQKYSTNLSIINSLLTLIEGVVMQEYSQHWDELIMPITQILHNIVVDENCTKQHRYYQIPHPWIQIKGLKVLSLLTPNKKPGFKPVLTQVLQKIVNSDHISSVKNRNNIQGAILFEAIKVIIRYKKILSLDLQREILSLLVIFLNFQEVNIKYLAYEASTRALVLPGSEDAFKDQMRQILNALEDLDPSIRRRALDLAYLMANKNNVNEIIEELLKYTETTDANIQEELVLKIAILAESYAPNLEWYLDVIINLLGNSGNYITDDIWWRCCQVVTGFGDNVNHNLRNYSVGTIMHALGAYNCSENLIKMATYILPEYGLNEDLVTPKRMYQALNRKFQIVSMETKCMILDAYFKIAGHILLTQQKNSGDEEVLNNIYTELAMNQDHIDLELQKRAYEYLAVLETQDENLYQNIFAEIDTFDPALEESNKLLSMMIKLLSVDSSKRDPTYVNKGQELIKKKQEILKSRMENYRLVRKKGNLKYEDLFIEAENVEIKFYNYKNLMDICNSRLALKGKNILLSPDNLQLPKTGLNYLKQLLIAKSGVLYEDKLIQIMYKSEFKGPKGRGAFRLQSKLGKITSLKIFVNNDGGMKIHVSQPQLKGEICDVLFYYENDDIIVSLPDFNIFYSQNNQDKTLSLALPVFVHNFALPYEMDNRAYMQVYNRFTKEDKYFKLDEFLQINGLTSSNLKDFMKKVKKIMSNFLHMHVQVYPNEEQLQVVYGTSQVYRNTQDNNSIPYIIEIEAFDEIPDVLRVSMRCTFNPFIVHSLYQILQVYLDMANS